MAKKSIISLSVHSLSYQGKRLLGDNWQKFIGLLRSQLKHYGHEAPDSNSELLLFIFDHPFAALSAISESLDKAKQKTGLEKSQNDIPIQIVINLEKKGNLLSSYRQASASVWDSLHHNTIYVSRALKLQWDQLMVGKKLPPCQFIGEETGLFQLKFAETARIKTEKLFLHRETILHGPHKECFYCGMTNHQPANCPSKLLTTEFLAINNVGYLSFSELNESFKKAFSNQKKMITALDAGVDAAQIRKDSTLRLFVSYFDINLIYQPRYLWHIAFSVNENWDGTAKTKKLNIDRSNLKMGLDCLRVGKHKEALVLLKTEVQMITGKKFYANIGLAFVSLELGRADDMIQFLELAKGSVNNEKERIYVNLLISRYNDLAGHLWKANEVIQSIYSLYPDCAEVHYRKAQILVRIGDSGNALTLLQNLTANYRHIFMAALMDPLLLPIHGMVENMLETQLQIKTSNAAESLAQAKNEYETLKIWFDYEDPDLQTNLKVLDNLEKQYEQKSCFDLLDVANKAKALVHSSPRMKGGKLDELNDKVDKAVIIWQGYNKYWKFYSYKFLFNNFQKILIRTKRKLVETRSVAAKSLGEAIGQFNSAKQDMNKLQHLLKKMNKVKSTLDIFVTFSTKLLLSELILGCLILLIFSMVSLLGTQFLSDDLVNLFQKKGLFIAAFLAAPLLAFVLTLRSLTKK